MIYALLYCDARETSGDMLHTLFDTRETAVAAMYQLGAAIGDDCTVYVAEAPVLSEPRPTSWRGDPDLTYTDVLPHRGKRFNYWDCVDGQPTVHHHEERA